MPEIELFFGGISHFVGCLGGILWVLMLIHCVKNSQLQRKGLWFLLIFFTQWVGAAIYCCIYVVPRSFWGRAWQWLQASPIMHWSSFSYQPSQPQQPHQSTETYQPYQSYQQGYQAQAPQYNQYNQYPPTPPAVYIAQEEQASSVDYEQPQTMYPEMPPQEI